MFPLILPNDQVILQKSSSYQVSDVVAYLQGKRLVAHRIIYASPDGDAFITKGDNNVKTDKAIPSNQILGKVIAVKRGNKKIPLTHLYLTQSSFYLTELGKVQRILKRKRIRYIILRGIISHLYFSGEPPRRHYADCDILVKPKDFQKTIEVLQTAGYQKSPATLFGKDFITATESNLTKPLSPYPVIIDLHRSLGIPFTKLVHLNPLFPKIPHFEKNLFGNTIRVRLNRTTFPLLKKEFLLVYLILHWYRHNFEGAHRADLIRSLVGSGVDVSAVTGIARKYGVSSVIYLGFRLLQKYFDMPLPQGLLEKLRVRGATRLFVHLSSALSSPFATGTRAYSGIKRVLLISFLSPVSLTNKMALLFSFKTLRFIPLTLYSFVSGKLTKAKSSRYITEDYAFHSLNPDSKTKSRSS